MWINVDGLACYISEFTENGYSLRRCGDWSSEWNMIQPDGFMCDFMILDEGANALTDKLKTFMPKTYALLKEELEKHNGN